MDKEILIKGIIANEEQAIEEFYKSYALKAYRTAVLLCGSEALAEDIIQDSFIICCRSLKSLKNPEALNTYFYRILTRQAYKHFRAEKRKLPLEETTLGAFSPKDYTDLYNAIKALPVKLKTTLVLFYFNDMPIEQIAKVTAVPQGTVKSRLHRARRLLAVDLKEEYLYD